MTTDTLENPRMIHRLVGRPARSLTPGRTFIVSFLLLLGLSSTWALASPMSSVPDEPSHAVRAAAVVRGEFAGVRQGTTGQSYLVQVPGWVALSNDITCFAFQPQITPNCSTVTLTDPNKLVGSVTTAGHYNPVYYLIVGLPSLVFTDVSGYYAMRILSAALSCLLLASMFSALGQLARHRWTQLAAIVSITPMVVYLNGSINPNSLEFAAIGAILANLILLLERSEDRQSFPARVIWITVATVLLSNTKGLSLLWLLIAVIAAFSLYPLTNLRNLLRSVWVWCGVGLIAVSCIFALWWIVAWNSLASPSYNGAGSNVIQGLLTMFDRTFDYAVGLIGFFGWLDTPSPLGVQWAWGLALGILVVGALAFARGRQRFAVWFSLTALAVLPPILQASIVGQQGYVWQGRYNLALFVILVICAGRALDERFGNAWNSLVQRGIGWVLAILALANVYAFLWALRRYVVGITPGKYWYDMILRPAWQPPLGWFTLTVVYTLIVGAALLFLYRRRPSITSSDHSEAPTALVA